MWIKKNLFICNNISDKSYLTFVATQTLELLCDNLEGFGLRDEPALVLARQLHVFEQVDSLADLAHLSDATITRIEISLNLCDVTKHKLRAAVRSDMVCSSLVLSLRFLTWRVAFAPFYRHPATLIYCIHTSRCRLFSQLSHHRCRRRRRYQVNVQPQSQKRFKITSIT